MVKLDVDYLIRKLLKKTFSDEKEKKDAFKKINHLCLSNRLIHQIGDLSFLPNIAVLYLHENKLSKIENLDQNLNITHLYLQHNGIEKIENLNHLKKLQKLYLGHNQITVVESLDGLSNLQELHIESQTLPTGESLYFDPRTVRALSTTLRVLDISNDQITALEDLKELEAIEELDASNNNIAELYATCRVLAQWQELKDLQLGGNPLVRVSKYAEKITSITLSLRNLDGRVIKEETRNFLQQFELAKHEKRKAEEKRSSQLKFSSDVDNLAKHLPFGIRNSVSRSILKETIPSTTNLIFTLSQLPEIKELNLEKRLMPRPVRKNVSIQKTKLSKLHNGVIPEFP